MFLHIWEQLKIRYSSKMAAVWRRQRVLACELGDLNFNPSSATQGLWELPQTQILTNCLSVSACAHVCVKQNKITVWCWPSHCPSGLQSSHLYDVGVGPDASRAPWGSDPCDLSLTPLWSSYIFWAAPSFPRCKKSYHRLVWVCGEALGLHHIRLNCGT